MERFLKRHEGRVLGTIAGFDRVLFRGNLSSICHLGGMDRFMSSQRILYKDFKPFVEKISERVKEHAKQFAAAAQPAPSSIWLFPEHRRKREPGKLWNKIRSPRD